MNQSPQQLTRFSDFAISFTPHPVTGDVLMVTGINSVVQAVMNLVQLNHYEVPFHPEIGGNLRRMLFEQPDPVVAGMINDEITNLLTNFEPRVQIDEILVSADPAGNGYSVSITFFVVNNVAPITVSMFLTRLR
jgi:hypothetical protein